MTKETLETTNKLIISTAGKDIKSQEIFESLESISSEELIEAGKEIETKIIEKEREEAKRKEEEKIEKLKGNTYAILKDLKENHVKVEENTEMMGYKGKKVHIDLPALGDFEGFKFDYFVSDYYVLKREFIKQKLLKRMSLNEMLYSMKDIAKLLQAMNKYMIELQGENDGDMDYENELKLWKESSKSNCTAGDCLRRITGLDDPYWLSDVDWRKHSRIKWYFNDYHCYFGRCDNSSPKYASSYGKLLFRLSK